MKTEQHQNARNLYMQTSLSKSQIAELLGISRTTIYNWAAQGNWDRLKKSAQHMPAIMAEKFYYVLGHMADDLLSESRIMKPCTRQEADAIYKLTLSINKLKNRSTLNENMEAFQVFLDQLKQSDPTLAAQLLPHMSEYFTRQASIYSYTHQPADFNAMGFAPAPIVPTPDSASSLAPTLTPDIALVQEDARPDLEEEYRHVAENIKAQFAGDPGEDVAVAETTEVAEPIEPRTGSGYEPLTDEERESFRKLQEECEQEVAMTREQWEEVERIVRAAGDPDQIKFAIENGLFASLNPDLGRKNRAA